MAGGTHRHGGHRSRLKRRAETEGLHAFEPHEVLELLLYTVIPRRDVNPLAHELIDRFGSLSGVINAPVDALQAIPGLGVTSAKYLSFLRDVTERYRALTLDDRPKLTNLKRVSAHTAHVLKGAEGEQIWLFSMNMAGHLLGSSVLAAGDWRGKLTLRQAVEPALRYHAQSAVLMQTRRPGNLVVRPEDIDLTERLARQFLRVRIRLLDSILVAGGSVLSFRQQNLYQLSDESRLAERELQNLYEHWLDDAEDGGYNGS